MINERGGYGDKGAGDGGKGGRDGGEGAGMGERGQRTGKKGAGDGGRGGRGREIFFLSPLSLSFISSTISLLPFSGTTQNDPQGLTCR